MDPRRRSGAAAAAIRRLTSARLGGQFDTGQVGAGAPPSTVLFVCHGVAWSGHHGFGDKAGVGTNRMLDGITDRQMIL